MTTRHQPPSPFLAGIKSCCPRCGEGHLFAGFLKVGSQCESCGLDYSFADSGDGPAVLIIIVAGAIVMALWAVVEALFHPPVVVHLILWVPTIIGLSLALMRPFKATMIALQYQNEAREGRHD